MTLTEAKRQSRCEHPNLRVNGWDERDYELWSQVRQLSSYGLVAGDTDNPMVSRKDVIAIIERIAEERFEREWRSRLAAPAKEPPK